MDRNNSNNRTTARVLAATAIIASIALLALAGLTGSICAAIDENAGESDGEIAGAAVSAASVTDSINYQGRLTNSSTGEPLTGPYDMTFVLYEVDFGGTHLAADTHAVDVADGLFNTHINFGTDHFDGRELWLGVEVEADPEMTPRQELRPVPYALGLKPGAHVKGHILLGSVFSVTNTGDSSGSYGIESETKGLIGVRGESTHVDGAGIAGYGYGANGQGVFGQGTARGVQGCSVHGDGVYGKTTGSDGHAGHFTTAAGQYLNGATVYAHNSNSHGIALYARNDASDDVTAAFINMGTGYLIKGFGGDGGNHEFAVHNDGKVWTEGGVQVVGNARVTTPVLEITGGSDLSEQFEIRGIRTDLFPSPGMVVSIDPENAGDLVVSNRAYDRRVAGIISGAGGVKPGMLMGQNGSEADGTTPVALTGRVYCWADASNSPIKPGDLLTTSDIPGHAMKVTDYDKAQGAILGKAMSSLEEGQDLVLVLVTLQ